MSVIIATMVKNEEDIVQYWIDYYGTLFGFQNLHIIDNFSTDRTFEIAAENLSKGIHLERKLDYTKKGEYMTALKNRVACRFFFPVDIDEFVVLLDKGTHSLQHFAKIVPYFQSLPRDIVCFKMNYIHPIRTRQTSVNDLSEFTAGSILDYKEMAKTFLQNVDGYSSLQIDHGNHVPNNIFHLTDLHLVHFHNRTHKQYVQKVFANVEGLGYSLDTASLRHHIEQNRNCVGNHHIRTAIEMLEHPEKEMGPAIVARVPRHCVKLSNFFKVPSFAFITLTNSGYIDITLNCLQSLKRLGLATPVCYCIGKEGYTRLLEGGYKSVLIDEETNSNFQIWREGNWSNIVVKKFYIIYENLLHNDYVIYTDSDIVYEKEFLSYLFETIGNNDILIQNDTLDDTSTKNLCSGFMCIRSNANTLNLFHPTKVVKYKDKRGWGDQIYINKIQSQLNIGLLPLDQFPNGGYFYEYSKRLQPHLIHFNWRSGHQKKETMKSFSKWYI